MHPHRPLAKQWKASSRMDDTSMIRGSILPFSSLHLTVLTNVAVDPLGDTMAQLLLTAGIQIGGAGCRHSTPNSLNPSLEPAIALHVLPPWAFTVHRHPCMRPPYKRGALGALAPLHAPPPSRHHHATPNREEVGKERQKEPPCRRSRRRSPFDVVAALHGTTFDPTQPRLTTAPPPVCPQHPGEPSLPRHLPPFTTKGRDVATMASPY